MAVLAEHVLLLEWASCGRKDARAVSRFRFDNLAHAFVETRTACLQVKILYVMQGESEDVTQKVSHPVARSYYP